MEHVTVDLKEIINRCRDWEDEYDYVTVTINEKNKTLEIGNLSRKDNNELQKQTFDSQKIKEVTIGRDSKCNFAFPKDKSFSRIHTTFTWDDNEQVWKIIDGSKNKSSTNGTWVFGTHSFQIQDQMVVEILTSKVRFSVMQNNDK